jgi:phosphinothricin acetyltransferase
MPAIRSATPADAEAITAIYAHHVAHGTATFDTDPPAVEATAAKIAEHAARGWPFLVAAVDGTVAGYASASQFRPRAAYAHACEDSIYVAPDRQGQGLGRALLTELIVHAEAAGFRQMLAVIGDAEPASVALHAALGFQPAGRMKSVGRKFGRWLDTVYMQRALGAGHTTPPA